MYLKESVKMPLLPDCLSCLARGKLFPQDKLQNNSTVTLKSQVVGFRHKSISDRGITQDAGNVLDAIWHPSNRQDAGRLMGLGMNNQMRA